MGLVNKLKEILFDDEVVEDIPTITKEKTPKKASVRVEPEQDTEDIIIREIKTSPRKIEEDIFDMPRLKEEARKEIHTNSFSFPAFDDDEDLDIRINNRSSKMRYEKLEEEPPKKTKVSAGSSIYDPVRTDDIKRERMSTAENKKSSSPRNSRNDEKKIFSPSPIISPVYGVLNENYKKEDIVSKRSSNSVSNVQNNKIDLDSVRRKAYGSLEDDIDSILGEISEDSEKHSYLDETPANKSDENIKNVKTKKEKKVAKSENLDDKVEEEDLFDLIDSLYAGKGED